MKIDDIRNTDRAVSCTVTPEALQLIEHYAEERKLYRSNWLREAIFGKLEREFEAEKSNYPGGSDRHGFRAVGMAVTFGALHRAREPDSLATWGARISNG